jgi:putative membrane protein
VLRALARISYTTTLQVLGGLFALVVLALGIAPLHRADWALENVLVVVFLVVSALAHRRMPLSRLSWLLIFLFLCLHEVGAHYTYSEVPYDDALRALFGWSLGESLGFTRNHFDRLVHFAYGLLLAYPVRELFLRVADVRGFWGYFLPISLTMSTSMLYELVEWGAAVTLGGDLGTAYLGTQGDEWDAHKDMAFASLGALIAMGLTAGVNVRLDRDFAREWRESLRVKRSDPLGEEEIERLARAPGKPE